MRSLIHLNSIENTSKNLHFLSTISSISRSYFPPFCDTCDSKKTTSLLEGARVHAYEKKKMDITLICYLHYAK